MEPIINQRIYMTIARIEEEMNNTGCADIFKWWTFMATDVIGELSFGESFRMLELGKVNILRERGKMWETCTDVPNRKRNTSSISKTFLA